MREDIEIAEHVDNPCVPPSVGRRLLAGAFMAFWSAVLILAVTLELKGQNPMAIPADTLPQNASETGLRLMSYLARALAVLFPAAGVYSGYRVAKGKPWGVHEGIIVGVAFLLAGVAVYVHVLAR